MADLFGDELESSANNDVEGYHF